MMKIPIIQQADRFGKKVTRLINLRIKSEKHSPMAWLSDRNVPINSFSFNLIVFFLILNLFYYLLIVIKFNSNKNKPMMLTKN